MQHSFAAAPSAAGTRMSMANGLISGSVAGTRMSCSVSSPERPPAFDRPMPVALALKQIGSRLRPRDLSDALALPPSRIVYFLGRPLPDRHSVSGRGSTALEGLIASQSKTEDGQFGPIRVGDQIDWRYEVLAELGRGSFGVVLRCFDHKHKTEKAIKVVNSLPRYTQQAKTEMQLMEYLRDAELRERRLTISQYGQLQPSPQYEGASTSTSSVIRHNIVQLEQAFRFRGHLCLVMPLAGQDLFSILKRGNFVGLPLPQVRVIAAQVLEALVFLRRMNILHADLKPENALIRMVPISSNGSGPSGAAADGGNTAIRTTLIDLGSSCFDGKQLYSYIGSRFYRAPEIVLNLRYGPESDIWSLGVMLSELLTGRPLFPGEDEREQLALMQQVLGMPPTRMLNASPPSTRSKYYELVEPEDQSKEEEKKKEEGGKAESGAAALAGAPTGGVGSGLGLLSRNRGVGASQPYYRPLNLINSKGRKRVVGSRTLREVIEAHLRAAQATATQQKQVTTATGAAGVSASSSSSLGGRLSRAMGNPGLSLADPQMQLFLDFVSIIVQWDPKARPTPLEASRHPWIRDLMPRYLYDPECVAASIGSLAFSSASGSSSSSINTQSGASSPALVPAPRPQFDFDRRAQAGANATLASSLSPLGRHSLSVGPTSMSSSGAQTAATAAAATQRQQQSLGPGRRPRRRLSALYPGQSPSSVSSPSEESNNNNTNRAPFQASGRAVAGPGGFVTGLSLTAGGNGSLIFSSPQAAPTIESTGLAGGSKIGAGTVSGSASNAYHSRGRTLHRVINHSSAATGSGLQESGGAALRSEREQNHLVPRPPPPQGSTSSYGIAALESGSGSASQAASRQQHLSTQPVSNAVLSPLPPRAPAAAGWVGHNALLASNGVGLRPGAQQGMGIGSLVTASLTPLGEAGGSGAYGLGPPLSSSSSSIANGSLGSSRHRSVGGSNELSSSVIRGRGGLSVPASYRLTDTTGMGSTAGSGLPHGLSVIMEERTPVPSIHSHYAQQYQYQHQQQRGGGMQAAPASVSTSTPPTGAGQPWQRRRQQYYQSLAAVSTPSSSPSSSGGSTGGAGATASSGHSNTLTGSLSPPGGNGIRQALLEARGLAASGTGEHGGYGSPPQQPQKLSYSSPFPLSSTASAAAMAVLAPNTGNSGIPRLAPSTGRGGPTVVAANNSNTGGESKSIGRLLAAARQMTGPTASAAGGSPS